MSESMNSCVTSDPDPLVLHVIPTGSARGAQREARALTDALDSPGVRRHRLLTLFGGANNVPADIEVGHPGGQSPAVGLDVRLVVRLWRELSRLQPAVVVAHGSEPLKYLIPAMAGRRRPLAYYAIGTYSGSRGRLQLELWKWLVGRADVVAAEGQEVRLECIELLGVPEDRVHLCPNGRDTETFAPAPTTALAEQPVPLVVFVGALTENKRPDRFIQVVDRLRALDLPVRAVMVGDGPLRDEVSAAARQAGVELLGARSDVAEQLRRSSVLVFPSRPAGEGMPGVLIEAGLSGLPCVATDVPGVRSIVDDGVTGVVVPVDDLDAMVEATRRLLCDPDRCSRMGEAARRHCVANFSMESVTARWLELLRPLLGGAVAVR
ncbi:MAG: glycosyltransferase family 4 protein [Acidimicrobiales bacterium]